MNSSGADNKMQSKLNFEKPLIELDAQIQQLKAFARANPEINISKGVTALEENAKAQTRKIFKKLTRWDKVLLARHEQRPQSFTYIGALFDDPVELHGDKCYGDDRALVGGLACFEGQPIVYLAQQKGRDLKERQEMSFGYTRPEGYRKAKRLMKLAEKFDRPIISLVDTPGAHFDRGSEERGQSVAIAENLAEMARLPVPILVVVIGEGGSGGALAIAAEDLIQLDIIDGIIHEPLGGAHRNPVQATRNVKRAIKKHLADLIAIDRDTLVQQRYDRYRRLGVYGERWM